MRYTEKQQRAVSTRSSSVIVSAAAGSGKTSVLTQRIVRLVREGTDIRNMLVVTFTRAAAAEMRQRITGQLYAAAREEGGEWLRGQAELTSAADISTFHSFCSRVIREKFDALGVAPGFRILGEHEALSLKNDALRELFDRRYEDRDADLLRLLARFTRRADEAALAVHILRVYDFMMGKPRPFEWAEEFFRADPAEKAVALDAEYEALLLEKVRRALSFLVDGQGACFELTRGDVPGAGEAVNWLEDKQAILGELAREVEQRGTGALDGIGTPGKLLPLRGVSREAQELVKPFVDKAKKQLEAALKDSALEDFRAGPQQQIAHVARDAAAMVELVREFGGLYAAQKTDRGALDYADLEHMALRALETAGQPGRYDYVFIDEYQDTSQVQEEILSILCAGACSFMVGDIKQSIYRFRMADPGIFRRKVEQYTRGGEEIIYMNENFRSAQRVIEAVNFLMSGIMCEEIGEITYDEGERLIGCKPGGQAQVLLCDMEAMPDMEAGQAQAMAIAGSIEALLQGGQAAPEDVAILVRSRSATAMAIADELERRHIPCSMQLRGVRETRELDLIVNLLKIIDNTADDIPLLSVLRSFIGGLDETAFAQIRVHSGDTSLPFYEACRLYARQEDGLGARLREFFEMLDGLKLRGNAMALGDFLGYVLERFDFDVYISCLPGAEYKQEAYASFRMLLSELAAASGTLYLLLRALDGLRKKQGGYVDLPGQAGGAGVKIMTIHQSKGLEFPVVYLADLNRRFNREDEKSAFLLHEDFGILPLYVDEERLIKKTTLERELCKEQIWQEHRSEELRMLYVAMTRAKERLFFVGYAARPAESLAAWRAMRNENAVCFLDWVMAANERDGAIPVEFIRSFEAEETAREGDIPVQAQRELPLLLDIPPEKRVPAKVSVSAVRRHGGGDIRSFLQTETQDTEEIGGARLGTLIHTVMDRLVPGGGSAAQAAQELLDRELIDEAERQAVLSYSEMIDEFLGSGLFSRIAAAQRVLKEQPFSLVVKPSEIGFEGRGDMQVQGILDLAFLEDGKWVLVDYKTDRVTPDGLDEKAQGYRVQLELYARALSTVTKKEVKEKYLYFMRVGRAVSV